MNVSTTMLSDNLNKVEKVVTNPSANNDMLNQKETTPTTSTTSISEMTDENGKPTEQAYQIAINKMNEFMEYSQKNSKFILHKDLQRYYVEIVDAKTQDVIKEIPPKELLDAYYEMQKFVGKIFDSQA